MTGWLPLVSRELSHPAGYRIRTWTWAEAVARLEEFTGADLLPMRDFIAEIAASPYAGLLFPAASMDTVLVARIPDFSCSEPHLRMKYDFQTRQVTFLCWVDPYSQQTWTTQVPIGRAFAHFEHLMLCRLRWCQRKK
jgi:hypothetical protein